MIRLLDTSLCVQILRRRDPETMRWFDLHRTSCHICDIVAAELVFGFVKRPNIQSERLTRAFLSQLPSLPFGLDGAEAYARIRTDLESRGLPIGSNDFFIAATALAHDATLITRNTGEFSRIPGLKIEDWRA